MNEVRPTSELGDQLGEFVLKCLEAGFELPLYVTAVGINGAMMFFRGAEGDEGFELVVIAGCEVEPGMAFPIHVLITDATGNAAAASIDREGPQALRVLH